MIDFYIVRRGYQIHAATASDAVEIQRLPANRVMRVTADPLVPKKLPRWYRAMVQTLGEGIGRDRDGLHRELMIRAGMFDSVVIAGDGTTRFSPQSTAEWGAVEWRTYIDRVLPIIIAEYAGETRAEFRNRVDAFLGVKLKEAWEDG